MPLSAPPFQASTKFQSTGTPFPRTRLETTPIIHTPPTHSPNDGRNTQSHAYIDQASRTPDQTRPCSEDQAPRASSTSHMRATGCRECCHTPATLQTPRQAGFYDSCSPRSPRLIHHPCIPALPSHRAPPPSSAAMLPPLLIPVRQLQDPQEHSTAGTRAGQVRSWRAGSAALRTPRHGCGGRRRVGEHGRTRRGRWGRGGRGSSGAGWSWTRRKPR